MKMDMEKTLMIFAGHGIAVVASSASDENPGQVGGTHSLYTGILTTAMTVNRKIRQEEFRMADINEI